MSNKVSNTRTTRTTSYNFPLFCPFPNRPYLDLTRTLPGPTWTYLDPRSPVDLGQGGQRRARTICGVYTPEYPRCYYSGPISHFFRPLLVFLGIGAFGDGGFLYPLPLLRDMRQLSSLSLSVLISC